MATSSLYYSDSTSNAYYEKGVDRDGNKCVISLENLRPKEDVATENEWRKTSRTGAICSLFTFMWCFSIPALFFAFSNTSESDVDVHRRIRRYKTSCLLTMLASICCAAALITFMFILKSHGLLDASEKK